MEGGRERGRKGAREGGGGREGGEGGRNFVINFGMQLNYFHTNQQKNKLGLYSIVQSTSSHSMNITMKLITWNVHSPSHMTQLTSQWPPGGS